MPNTSTLKSLVIPLFICVGLAFAQYYPTLNFGYNIDDEFVTNNSQVERGFEGIADIFTSKYFEDAYYSFGYRPIAETTFAIENGVWGNNPGVSHFINILLYGIIGLLIFLTTNRITKQSNWAFCTAIIFLSMPIHTEVVASLKNREELLVGLFFLLSFSVYLHKSTLGLWKATIILILLFALALLTKLTGILIPIVIGAYWIFVEEGKSIQFFKNNSNKYFPVKFWVGVLMITAFNFVYAFFEIKHKGFMHFFSLSLILGLTFFIFKGVGNALKQPSVKSYLLLGVPVFLISYFQLYNQKLTFIGLSFALPFVVTALIKFFKSYGVKFRLSTRGGLMLFVLYGISLFAIWEGLDVFKESLGEEVGNTSLAHNQLYRLSNVTLSIKLFLLTVFKYAELLVYPSKLLFFYGYNTMPIPNTIWDIKLITGASIAIASAGLFIWLLWQKRAVLAWAWLMLIIGVLPFSNLIDPVAGIVGERLLFFGSIGLAIFLGGVFTTIFKMLPNSFQKKQLFIGLVTIICLPYMLKSANRCKDWETPFSLYKADMPYLKNSARANAIYADALLSSLGENPTKQEVEKVIFHFEKSVIIDSTFFNGWNNLGSLYASYTGELEKAKAALKKCLNLRPDYFDAHYNLGYILETEENYPKAIHHYKKALTFSETDVEIIQQIAQLYLNLNYPDSSYIYLKKLAPIYPNDPVLQENLANISLLSNDSAQALIHIENALSLQPNVNLENLKNQLSNQ